MRILFLGNPSNQFIQNLAGELTQIIPEIQIDIISIPNYTSENKDNLYNRIFNIKIGLKFLEKIPFVKILFYYFGIKMVLKHSEKYDVISIQMVYYYYFLAIKLLRKKTDTLCLTFWGSDYNHLLLPYKYLLRQVVRKADKISCANPKLLTELINYFRINENKLNIVRFGLRPLDYLAVIMEQISKEKAKEKLGLDEKFIITIGTNASRNQNHIDIIDNIIKIKPILPKNYILVFPMTYGYGNKNKYVEEIRNKLLINNLNFLIFEKYLSDQEIAYLRLSTDIMIQLQNHDQLSGAMQEHLFAGNIVITGSWLDYNVMKQNNIFFFEINQISELKVILPKLFEDIQLDFQKRKENSQKVWDLSSWRKNINNWLIFYGIKSQ